MGLPLCVRTDFADRVSAESLRQDGWRQIEVLLTYRSKPRDRWGIEVILPGAATLKMVDRAAPDDWARILDIVYEGFEHDRLHSDPDVKKEDADGAKRASAYRALNELPCFVWRRIDSPVAAFCALKHADNRFGPMMRIDLICVAEQYRGQGIARSLIKGALQHFAPCAVTAGTQDTNEPAKALYASLGMEVVRKQYTWHKFSS